MAALALASSRRRRLRGGRRAPAPAAVFRNAHGPDLRDGRDLKALLYEVCADIDAGAPATRRPPPRCSRCWARPSTKRPRPATSRRATAGPSSRASADACATAPRTSASTTRASRCRSRRRRRRGAAKIGRLDASISRNQGPGRPGAAAPRRRAFNRRVVESASPRPGRGAAADHRDDGHAGDAPRAEAHRGAALGRGRAAPRRRAKKHRRPPSKAIHPTEPHRHATRSGLPAPGRRPDGRRRAVLLAGLKVERGAGPAPAARAAGGRLFLCWWRRRGPGAPLGVCARETFGRPLRDGHAVLARCVCVLTSGAAFRFARCGAARRARRDAGRRRRHAAPGAPRIFGRYSGWPSPRPAV